MRLRAQVGKLSLPETSSGVIRAGNANTRGLTVSGFRNDQLISAELDRCDPERVRLRMQDPHNPESVRVVIERLEDLQGVFPSTLRAARREHQRRRPAQDCRSALVHVRHLVFVEDLYTNRWTLRNREPWTKLGLLPVFLADKPDYSDVGNEPCDNLETVLSAWDRIHVQTRAFVADLTVDKLRWDTSNIDSGQGTVGGVLQGVAQHDLYHLRKARGDDLGGEAGSIATSRTAR